MTKTELESKHLAELHSLAAEASIPGYRMLPREALIEKLLSEESAPQPRAQRERRPESGRRRPRDGDRRPREARGERPPAKREPERAKRGPEGAKRGPEGAKEAEVSPEPARPKRRRRRRRWGRRKRVQVHDLLLSATPAGRTVVYAETREGCTTLLREVGAELSTGRGPDPIALLVDPSPEELAAWKRDAPKAEIVAAGQAHHAGDAIAQAKRRAENGESVIVLVDSLSRFADAFGGADDARKLFESGGSVSGSGSLAVVAAVERQ